MKIFSPGYIHPTPEMEAKGQYIRVNAVEPGMKSLEFDARVARVHHNVGSGGNHLIYFIDARSEEFYEIFRSGETLLIENQ